jgi:hypothetical protein
MVELSVVRYGLNGTALLSFAPAGRSFVLPER